VRPRALAVLRLMTRGRGGLLGLDVTVSADATQQHRREHVPTAPPRGHGRSRVTRAGRIASCPACSLDVT
jgi:hypothetical protein